MALQGAIPVEFGTVFPDGAYAAGVFEAATLTLYRGLADRYVKPVIGNVRLDKLTPAHVQRLVAETRNSETSRGSTPSAATQRHVHKLVRNALGDALRMELVTP